ncbi:MAG: hypothetical protein RLZZ227_1744 [Pseudomonadota bacterium]|jgi:uncharacterized membrane protein YebE (DUF533 family)
MQNPRFKALLQHVIRLAYLEQASEIYLVSRLAIDPDHAAERAYLQALGHRLQLPADLIAHLDHQVQAATTA